MKHLIVNGDDFGMSAGINRGIVEAHVRGILTSASLMVDMAASAEAAQLAGAHPRLGLGLHLVLDAVSDGDGATAEVERQLARFDDLTGRAPTHLDSHHHVHRHVRVLPVVTAAADRLGIPLRGRGGVREIGGFYGQWGGETHLEHIGPEALARLMRAEVADGVNELCCHPGYVDDGLRSSYAGEREAELATLCHPVVAAVVAELEIRLVTFAEVAAQ